MTDSSSTSSPIKRTLHMTPAWSGKLAKCAAARKDAFGTDNTGITIAAIARGHTFRADDWREGLGGMTGELVDGEDSVL